MVVGEDIMLEDRILPWRCFLLTSDYQYLERCRFIEIGYNGPYCTVLEMFIPQSGIINVLPVPCDEYSYTKKLLETI